MIHRSNAPSVSHFPDDMDLYQFMFEYFPSSRPDVRNQNVPLLIDQDSGHRLCFEQIKQRVDLLSLALGQTCGVEPDSCVSIFSANAIDYPIAIWACHRIGAVVSAANPSFPSSELHFQLQASKSTVLFMGEDPTTTKAGLEAASKAGIPLHRIIVIQNPNKESSSAKIPTKTEYGAWTLNGLVQHGGEILKQRGASALTQSRRMLHAGQAKTKLAFISFSSGTTGLPKAVEIQHSAPIANVLQAMAFNRVGNVLGAQGRFRPGLDVSLGVLPHFHIYGLIVGVHLVFWAGITNLVIPRFQGIEAMVQSIIKYDITLWWLVPPQVVMLCKDPSVSPYIQQLRKRARFVMVGAAPLSDDLSRQFSKLFPDLDWGQGYGMTETCTATAMHPPGLATVFGSAGRIFSNTEAKVVNSEGRQVGYDEPGELWVRGPQTALGYANNEEATQQMFLADGWVRTGDEVKINRQGDLFIVDRLKELIKVKGFQVAPAEIEGFLLDHPDVSDCGVVGIPDDSAGERPLAFITLSSSAKQRIQSSKSRNEQESKIKQSIMQFVADNKVRYKHLCGVTFIEAIPKTASGKILRRNMRELAKTLEPETFRVGSSKARL